MMDKLAVSAFLVRENIDNLGGFKLYYLGVVLRVSFQKLSFSYGHMVYLEISPANNNLFAIGINLLTLKMWYIHSVMCFQKIWVINI